MVKTLLRRGSILIGLVALTGLGGSAGANADRVTFVENVRCESGVCEVLRKTIPVFETVVEQDTGEFCAEYTKRLTGFRTFPSLDPEQPIQIPHFEQSAKRYFRCGQKDSVARTRPVPQPVTGSLTASSSPAL